MALGGTEVDPADVGAAQHLHPEREILQSPGRGDVGGIGVNGGSQGEDRPLAVVVVVGAFGTIAGGVGGGFAEGQGLQDLSGVGRGDVTAPGAAADGDRGTIRPAAGGAEATQLGRRIHAAAHVEAVDLHRSTPNVERGAGCEFR